MQLTDAGVVVTLTNRGRNAACAVPFDDDRREFADTPRGRSSAARGALTGMLLGASLWSTLLVVARGFRM